VKHHAVMKFMEQLQTDLKQAIHQHQHQLLLEVLQRRSQELTLGDLRKLLASPLGRGLDDVRLALLFGAAVPKSQPVAAPKKSQPVAGGQAEANSRAHEARQASGWQAEDEHGAAH
jgi:hypothetical protein